MPDLAPDTLARVTELLRRHPLIDGHNDLPWEARQQSGYDFDRLDLSQRLTTTHTDLPRLRDGGVGAQFWSVWLPSTLPVGALGTPRLLCPVDPAFAKSLGLEGS